VSWAAGAPCPACAPYYHGTGFAARLRLGPPLTTRQVGILNMQFMAAIPAPLMCGMHEAGGAGRQGLGSWTESRAVRAAVRAGSCPGPSRGGKVAKKAFRIRRPCGKLPYGTPAACVATRALCSAPVQSSHKVAIIHFSRSEITDNRMATQRCGTACCCWRGQCHDGSRLLGSSTPRPAP
jgi:hypothetical protein